MNELIMADLKTEISVGRITSNAAELLSVIRCMVEKYLNDNYIPNETNAKADRAELNRVEKSIAQQARQIVIAYNAPLDEFNVIVNEIRKTIKDAVQTVDLAVKRFEEKQKSQKYAEIQAYFDAKNFELVQLGDIFDDRWLNKTKPMKEVKDELDAKIANIYRDIEILEKLPEHGMAAKAFYLEKLDMGAALRQVEIHKENAAKVAREEANREERKTQEDVAVNAANERQEERAAAKDEKTQSLIESALGLPAGAVAAQKKAETLEYTLQFRGTEEQLFKLREYMTSQGIPYKKLVILENDRDAASYMKQKNIAGRVWSAVILPVEAA